MIRKLTLAGACLTAVTLLVSPSANADWRSWGQGGYCRPYSGDACGRSDYRPFYGGCIGSRYYGPSAADRSGRILTGLGSDDRRGEYRSETSSAFRGYAWGCW